MWIRSSFSKRSGKSLDPLKVGLTKQQQLFNIWPFLQKEPFFSFSWHISTLKSIYIYIFLSRKTYIDHHLTVSAAMFYFVKRKRLVNKGSTRGVLSNCRNKVPLRKKRLLTICFHLHHIQPLSGPPVSHHRLPRPLVAPSLFSLLASCSLAGVLVLPKWPDPSQANSWKDASFLPASVFSSF